MNNENNILRPPILNIPPTPPNPERAQVEQINAMRETITRICAEQCEIALRHHFNPSADIAGEDQIIEARYGNDLSDLDKVPDIVRSLREFSGNPSEFSSWKKSVDRLLRLYDSKRGTPKYFAILNTIRNKITGQADEALESYNTPLNWDSISKCLALHYADKRDLTTLEYQMSTLVQGNREIQVFYQEVYSHLSLIVNKLSGMDIGREALDVLAQTYRNKALDTFIRGLRGQMSVHLGMKEPRDLPQALQLCLKMQNQVVRSQFANSHGQNVKANKYNMQSPPQLQPRTQYRQNATPTFYPQLAHIPQIYPYAQQFNPPIHTMNNSNQYPFGQQIPNKNVQPPRPSAPKPTPRPEPMDIDTSIRTKAVNYMNRPMNHNQFYGKRPNDRPDPSRNPNGKQGNFHVNTVKTLDQEPQNYESLLQHYEAQEQFVPIDDYIQNQYDVFENDQRLETHEFADIHFLG